MCKQKNVETISASKIKSYRSVDLTYIRLVLIDTKEDWLVVDELECM